MTYKDDRDLNMSPLNVRCSMGYTCMPNMKFLSFSTSLKDIMAYFKVNFDHVVYIQCDTDLSRRSIRAVAEKGFPTKRAQNIIKLC